MGIERKTTSWRPSDETRMQLKAIQVLLAPMAETVSDTLRIVIDLVFRWFFTPGTLQGIVATLQGLLRNASQCAPQHPQMAFAFPPASDLVFAPRIFPPRRAPATFEQEGVA
jgi:hypothetical protein